MERSRRARSAFALAIGLIGAALLALVWSGITLTGLRRNREPGVGASSQKPPPPTALADWARRHGYPPTSAAPLPPKVPQGNSGTRPGTDVTTR